MRRRNKPRPAGAEQPILEGSVLTGTVRDLGARGEGVLMTDRGARFVAGALPGDVIRIRELDRRRGALLEIIHPSPDRVEPACPYVAQCGGCPLMPLTDTAERTFKMARVERATGLLPAWVDSPRLGYRRRARLGFEGRPSSGRPGSDRVTIGYRQGRSRRLVAVDRCVVLALPLETARAQLSERLGPHLTGTGEIGLALGENDRVVMSLVSETPQSPALYAALGALVESQILGGVEALVGGASAPAVFGDPTGMMTVGDGLEVRAPARAFAQANDEVNRALVARVVGLASPAGAEVVELYAGAGNFTLALAREATRVIALEFDPDLVRALRANAERAGLSNITVHEGDAVGRLDAVHRADIVVLDPPRAGAKDAVAKIAALRPQRIVMVSCDPATLGRDIDAFGTLGYRPNHVTCFDMFPHTAHVESAVRLVRR